MKAFKIKDCPEYYITYKGDIYSRNYNKTGRIKKLKPFLNPRLGYLQINLGKRSHYIHRLVAETFIPNPENKPEVNHKNGIRNDNRVENLEWCLHSENIKHSYDVLKHKKWMLGKKGKNCCNSKTVLQIKKGICVAEYGSTLEAERKTGIYSANISKCCKKIRKSAGGCQWEYKDENDNL